MKTQDTIDDQVTLSSPHPRSKARARLATLGALLIVALVVGASAIVYAQLGQHHKGQASTPPPPPHAWTQVLHGYTFASLMAAPSDASVLYACATPTQPASSNANNASYTILRSADFGAHWQDVGSKAKLGYSCQLAINPSNSNELYAVSTYVNGQAATSVLLHSSDAGQTWSTIQPTLNIAGVKTAPVWNVQQLSMVGNALFGLQWLFQSTPTAHPVPLPKAYARVAHLVTSTDGGHTWTVIDQQLSASQQLVSGYAIDPSHTGTIYELVTVPWLPIEPASAEPAIATIYGNNGSLYKTSDNGATWHLLLQNLPFGTRMYLASENPQILYVGGSRIPLPLSRGAPVTDIAGPFQLQISRDGGNTWQNVPIAVQGLEVQSWLVSPNGQVYSYPASSGVFNGQPTAITGTVVPGKPVTIPPTPPQSKSSAMNDSLASIARPALTLSPSHTGSPAVAIQRYDPTTNAWNAVTVPPTYGALLAATSGGTNGTALWFMGTSNGQSGLYRYIA